MNRQRKPPKRPASKVSLDTLMVERGLTESREKAQAVIASGVVEVNGATALRPGALTAGNAEIVVRQGPAYVSRGGLKLEGALDALGVSPAGAVVMDVGASTGGFTDCLLQRGASRVYAVDAGRGQLAWTLRQDPRVIVLERHNARHPIPISEPLDLATVDVSFISLTLVLPNAATLLKPGGRLLALVKPQFEAERADVELGGVVRDPLVRARAVGKICLWAIDNGLRVRGVTPSPITGPKGNREVFILLQKP